MRGTRAWAAVFVRLSVVGLAGCAVPACPKEGTEPPPLASPFEVASYYYPSGWMGDGERGSDFVSLATKRNCRRPADEDGICTRITYRVGPERWSGIYWQTPDSNWGVHPGRKVARARHVVFWARGQRGGELVEFKAGGIVGPCFRDSFEISLGRTRLGKTWRQYEISLAGQDLSNVIGAFAWIASADSNPDGITFYLDDLRYAP